MNKNGFVAITSVLIIAAVTLSIAVSIALLGIDEADNSLDFKKGIESFNMAKACGEEGLLRSRNDGTYTSGMLTFPNGNCTISVSNITGGNQVNVTATVSGPPTYVKKISIVSQQDGNGVTIVTWQEVN